MNDHHDIKLVGRRVLVVEDEGLIALDMRDLLEKWGCEVLGPTGTVSATLSLLETVVPDAALLDINLRGGETSEPVAEVLNQAGCPFVVTTAFGSQDLGEPMVQAPLLSKPVNHSKLKQVLISMLSG